MPAMTNRRPGAALCGIALAAGSFTLLPTRAATNARRAPNEIVAAAPATDWRPVAPENLLVFELQGGHRIVMELAADFAPAHVANIRALARAHWFDGTPISRVQDNYVVQWAGAAAAKPLPPGVTLQPPSEYERSAKGVAFRSLRNRDAYARETGMVGGWPAARENGRMWLTHCYGMVGAGRDMPPVTGSGAELYAVIGHSPRHLDRNLAIVGRIVQGMEFLAALPRGGGGMGSYDPNEYVKITTARLASDLPPAAQPIVEVLDSNSGAYARWVESRANRPEAFFVHSANAIDICNAQVPVRLREPN